MISPKYGPILFVAVLSGLMSLLITGISTYRTVGLAPGILSDWAGAWLATWPIAFPVVLVVAPLTRRLVQSLISPGNPRIFEAA